MPQENTALDKHITRFLHDHHVMTIATLAGNQPWVAQCFYAFLEDECAIVFTSDADTRHIKEATDSPNVAISVVLETKIVGKIQGVQMEGILLPADNDYLDAAKSAYLSRFPFAVLMNTSMRVVLLNSIKMTDNRLGFGKKRLWSRPQ